MDDVRALDNISFSDWFIGKGGSRGSIQRMWDPIAYALVRFFVSVYTRACRGYLVRVCLYTRACMIRVYIIIYTVIAASKKNSIHPPLICGHITPTMNE